MPKASYYRKHREEILNQLKKRREKDPEFRQKCRDAEKRYNRKIKLEVLYHYGGNPPKCACCGESQIEFLQIDHIHGNGRQHRKMLGSGGTTLYRWLKRNNFPKGYRVLCANCNTSFGYFGYCPHKK